MGGGSTDAKSHEADGIDPWEKTLGLNWLSLLSSVEPHPFPVTNTIGNRCLRSSATGCILLSLINRCVIFIHELNISAFSHRLSREELPAAIRTATAVKSQVKEVEIREGSLLFSDRFSDVELCPLSMPSFMSRTVTEMRGSTNRSLRVLELGSGIGLTASQILASLLSSLPSLQPIDVEMILTDYHPDVLDNLEQILALSPSRHSLPEGCPSTLSEPEHAVWASKAVRYFLQLETSRMDSKRLEPMSASSASLQREDYIDVRPSFHLLLPLRPTFTKESETVHQSSGFYTLL
ncbi:hypothetical protein VP01_360g1 [Puccinia sorghi]|uniref:Uncharacterized protein n=1 Tax=Puccinia sorghi TaxID=27349 RepID=A0A0L6UV01_9BASI|nr:hypothetical protein VP01_360g1 [Puccinia sorghi]